MHTEFQGPLTSPQFYDFLGNIVANITDIFDTKINQLCIIYKRSETNWRKEGCTVFFTLKFMQWILQIHIGGKKITASYWSRQGQSLIQGTKTNMKTKMMSIVNRNTVTAPFVAILVQYQSTLSPLSARWSTKTWPGIGTVIIGKGAKPWGAGEGGPLHIFYWICLSRRNLFSYTFWETIGISLARIRQ